MCQITTYNQIKLDLNRKFYHVEDLIMFVHKENIILYISFSVKKKLFSSHFDKIKDLKLKAVLTQK